MNNSFRGGRPALVAVSSAAAAIALVSGCSNDGPGTAPSGSSIAPTSSAVAPATTTPSAAPAMTCTQPPSGQAPSGQTTSGQAPASNAQPTRDQEGSSAGPSQTASGGNSASATTVKPPSPPTGDNLPGENAGPSGAPGAPGRDNN